MLSELSQIFLTFLQKNMTVAVVIFAVLLARLLLQDAKEILLCSLVTRRNPHGL